MSAGQVECFFALALGFTVAGLIASFQLVTRRPASFRLLRRGPRPSTFAAIPMLVFAAPFIISNTIRDSRIQSPGFGAVTTIIAGGWSLMSGTAV